MAQSMLGCQQNLYTIDQDATGRCGHSWFDSPMMKLISVELYVVEKNEVNVSDGLDSLRRSRPEALPKFGTATGNSPYNCKCSWVLLIELSPRSS